MSNYITRAESITRALTAYGDDGDLTAVAMEAMAHVGGIDATDIIEAAQTLLDNAGGRGFVGGARVFGALFGIKDEDEAFGLAEVLVEWDRL